MRPLTLTTTPKPPDRLSQNEHHQHSKVLFFCLRVACDGGPLSGVVSRLFRQYWEEPKPLMGSTAIASVANALTPASPLVFVYNSTTGCSSSASKTTHGAFLFESKLASLFAQGFMRTHNPAAATIFYHPACLVDVFFNLRHRHDAPARAADIERTILADIARVGYSKTPHVVNSLRCFTADRRRRHGHDHLFQTLWADPFLNFCAEAFPTLDANRSIYLPYCRAQPAPPPAFQPTRPIRALFIGSVPSHERAGTRARRQSSVAALRRLAGAHVELISTHSDDVSVRALSLMRQAVYTLCPYGDPTPMLHPTRTHTHSRHTDSHTLTLTLTHSFPHSHSHTPIPSLR